MKVAGRPTCIYGSELILYRLFIGVYHITSHVVDARAVKPGLRFTDLWQIFQIPNLAT